MPDVLLTGGSGFVGGGILRRLVADGRSVRALVRSERAAEAVTDAGAEAVRGDVTDLGSLAAAVAGCRVVYHAAGLNATCLRDPDRLDRVNVAGTRNVIVCAARAGAERIVYTSSAATVGAPDGVVAVETTPHRGYYLSRYERSKHAAEMAAFAQAARLGIPLVAVNPASVHGPGRSTGSARIFIAYLRGRLRFAIRATFSLVFIDDVADAHLRAEELGVPGERYLVSGWVTTTSEATTTLGEITGHQRRVMFLPRWTMTTAGAFGGALSAITRKDTSVCPEVARTLRHDHVFDGSRARRDLGIEYTPPEVWLVRTVDWYRAQGLV